jgi:N-acyl-D-aspartate/D-glutamate deacylase
MNVASLLLPLLLVAADPAIDADIVLANATLHDGTGRPGRVGDLAIKGDRIVGVGQFAVTARARRLDATGLIVAPGMIDLHSHSDTPLTKPATRLNLNYLRQGVTTVVTGNCGFGPVDVAAYYKSLEKHGIGTNVAHLVPHNALRTQVMGDADRPATSGELAKMEALVDRGMADGAWGLSTGLFYPPGASAKTDEIIELAKVAARYEGIYASHIRNEASGLLPSVTEALTIGRTAKLPVHISHLKANGRKQWGHAADAIALIQRARADGLAVTADQYPYPASSTSLAAVALPPSSRSGGFKALQARFVDPEQGPKLRSNIDDRLGGQEGSARVRIASFSAQASWQGKDLVSLAKQEKKSVAYIVIDIERQGGASVVVFGMSDEDVRLIMQQPFVATASDGVAMIPASTVPHPRSYGTFPRKIGRFAIDEKVLPLAQAIRSATGLPADILRLPQRGYLKVGHFADIVAFDPAEFRDHATFERPHQYATGVRYLIVNGQLVIDDGKSTALLSGRVLRHEKSIPKP